MIQSHVIERLREWALWSAERADGQHFRPRGFTYTEWMPGSVGMPAQLPIHERALKTEQCVARLLLEERPLGLAVLCHYRDKPNWSASLQAQFLGIGLRTLWRRLEKSHSLLLGFMIDAEVGVVSPAVEALRRARAA